MTERLSRTLALLAAMLCSGTAAALAQEQPADKVLRLYNWADYFAPIPSAPLPKRPGSGSSMTSWTAAKPSKPS